MEDSQTAENSGSSEYDKVFITKNAEIIDAFSSHVIPKKMERAYLRGRINVMTQALRVEDRPASEDHHAKYVYEAKDQQQKHCCSGKEHHSLPPNSQEKNAGGMRCGCNHCVRASGNNPIVGGRGGTSHFSIAYIDHEMETREIA